MLKFSAVIPVKDEVDLIPKTLPSYYSVKPSEVLVCTDKPCLAQVRKTVNKVAEKCGAIEITRIIEVPKDPSWKFHQAHVRRTGFHAASYDRILTGDIDLIINRNVLKAVQMVGKDNIGLVSAKAYRGKGISATTFTGLYAIWRPYWLDSEPEGDIKNLVNPKQKLRQGITNQWTLKDFYGMGEDTYLRDCMIKKYRVVYLPDIGAIDLRPALELHPDVQFLKGIYFALRGRNLIGALARTAFRLQPHYICGHFYGKKLLRFWAQKQTYSLDRAREYWKYAPSSIGESKISSEELLRMPDEDVKEFIEKSIEYRNLKEKAHIYRSRVSEWIRRENVRKMLDFGCGLGQDGVYFSKTLGVEVTFADIVESNVRLTERYSRIWSIPTKSIYINTDPKEFRFPEVYDLIFANGVLHHTPQAREIVENLTRFLKPKGMFICMLYTPKHFKSRRVKTIEEYALVSEGTAPLPNPYTDYYTLEKAKKLFKDFSLINHWATHNGKFGWYVWKKNKITT